LLFGAVAALLHELRQNNARFYGRERLQNEGISGRLLGVRRGRVHCLQAVQLEREGEAVEEAWRINEEIEFS